MSMSAIAIMSELPKGIGGGNGGNDRMKRMLNHQDIAKVRRALFGPVDHSETREFLEKELAQLSTFKSDRWEFDFVNEVPLKTNVRYVWTDKLQDRDQAAAADPCPARRPRVDEEDISRLYAGEPSLDEDLRPRPKRFAAAEPATATATATTTTVAAAASSSSSSSKPSTAAAGSKQSYITDFMPKRKRQAQSTTKKELGAAAEGNAPKKARLTQPSQQQPSSAS